MGLAGKIGLAMDVAACRLFGIRKPLLVAWSVTNRCNRQCLYCDSPQLAGPELAKEQGFALLEQIRQAGGRVISFTGGEPLIHAHIGDYIQKAHSLGLKCGLNTNGILVREKIDLLKGLSFVKLSLDGEPELHDEIRGGNCARYVFDAIEACKENKIPVTLLTVLTSRNLDQVPYLYTVAEKYNVTVAFQPATGHALKSHRDNPITPEVTEYRACIDRIIEAKGWRFGKYIGNSIAGLRHLRQWPDPVPMKCEGLRASARVEPDGRVFHCGRMIRHMEGFDSVELGFAEAFRRLQVETCDFCWCAHRVETNLILGLQPSSVWAALKSKFF